MTSSEHDPICKNPLSMSGLMHRSPTVSTMCPEVSKPWEWSKGACCGFRRAGSHAHSQHISCPLASSTSGPFPRCMGKWKQNKGGQWLSNSPAQGRRELETHQWTESLNPLLPSPFVVTKKMLLVELGRPQALGPRSSQTQSSCQRF